MLQPMSNLIPIEQLIQTAKQKQVYDKVQKDKGADECLDLLETILEEAQQIAKDADDQNWNEILPNLLKLMTDSINDYNCFKNNEVELYHVTNRRFRDEHLQCVIDHLKKLADEFRDAMMALTKKEAAKFIELVAQLVEDFKDIKNC